LFFCQPATGAPVVEIIHEVIEVDTGSGIGVHDITPDIWECLQWSKITHGMAVISSLHTTTALAINEFEGRLVSDMKTFFNALIPADRPCLHNDIDLRDYPPDEPGNAHSHLIATLLSQSEVIMVVQGELQLGSWQSLLFIVQDGPRKRGINLQLWGN